MNLKKIIAFSSVLLCSLGLKAQVVNIPDEVFLEYILLYTNVDTNFDGQIQVSEAEAFTGTINVYNSGAKDLTGLQAFKNITVLQISKTAIANLDISNNTKLKTLLASSTQIATIDVSKNTSLTQIEATYNSKLTSFIFGDQTYTSLSSVNLSYCALTSIDLSKLPNITDLSLLSNKLTSVDVSNNGRLASLSLGSNLLTSLDVTKNTRLITFGIGLNQISSIDISKNTLLDIFNANGNPITTLDVSKNIYLAQLLLEYTKLEAIDISKLEMLRYFYVNGTNLVTIDASKNIGMIGLQASYCPQLTSVNMKNGFNTNMSLCVTTNDPKLTCIMVDSPSYSSSALLWEKDSTATYTTDCQLLSVSDSQLDNNVMVYPNPTADILNINEEAHSVSLTNYAGQIVMNVKNVKSVDISRLPIGTYIVKIQRKANGSYITKKVIKK